MKKISALILCRSGSKRLKQKHFKKIGNFTLIEIIINNFLKISEISEIYIATGPKKKNYIYEKILKDKYKKRVKFFYHENENHVNERIYKLSKIIRNDFLLTYSGDCPIVEKKFIKIAYSQFLKNKYFDYIKIKNCIIEGTDLYRRELWKKIYQYSKLTKELAEFPGYVIKKRPHLFREKELSNKEILIYQSKQKHLRASIDTQSDLDFFKAIFILNKNKTIDYKLIYENKKLSILNSHVIQKKKVKILSNKIFLIGLTSKKYGYGHLSRLSTIEREISETITSDVKKKILRSNKADKINNFVDRIKSKNYKNKIFIIDVPFFLKKKFNFLLLKNRIIFIDNIIKHKNAINIIPTLRKPNTHKSNCLYGQKALILKREINFANQVYKETKNYIFIFPGSTNKVPKYILNYCIKNKDLNFIIFSKEQNIKQKNICFFSKDDDFIKVSKEATAIITRFGVYVYECLALNKKVFVWDYKEDTERMKDIKYLEKKKYIEIFDTQRFKEKLKNKSKVLKNFKFGGDVVIKEINKLVNNIL